MSLIRTPTPDCRLTNSANANRHGSWFMVYSYVLCGVVYGTGRSTELVHILHQYPCYLVYSRTILSSSHGEMERSVLSCDMSTLIALSSLYLADLSKNDHQISRPTSNVCTAVN